jgi:lipoate-protein ligase A
MAADEVLLDSAIGGTASLRFYTWQVATLSLGYFQPEAVRHADARLAGLPWVRRPSGGSALVHHHEVTYALALPPGAHEQGGSWLCRFHHVLCAALAGLGVGVEVCPQGEERKLGEVLCFLHHTAGDLRIGSAKVVGSAQRLRRGVLLQHGGILLARSPHTPALPGLAELSGRRLARQEVAVAVIGELERALGWVMEPGEWMGGERDLVERLVRDKYTSERWNGRR